MHLLYDLTPTQPVSVDYHGGSEYAVRVLEHLCEVAAPGALSTTAMKDRPLDPRVETLLGERRIPVNRLESKAALSHLLAQPEITRFYAPQPEDYHDIVFEDVEFFCTMHGPRLIEQPSDRYEHLFAQRPADLLKARARQAAPEAYRRRHWNRLHAVLSAPCRRRMVFVSSEHTKYALQVLFPDLRPEELSVLYCPLRTMATPGEDLHHLGVSPGRFFLLVSGQRWVKNTFRAMQALDLVFSNYPDVTWDALVLGLKKPGSLLGRMKNPQRFHCHGYVEDAVLQAAYRDAACLFFPTLNEGFGYPPLECMRYGTPVISSPVTSTTELFGDAVVYCNPYSIEEMAGRLLYLARDPGACSRYGEAGRRRAETVAKRQEADLAKLGQVLLAP